MCLQHHHLVLRCGGVEGVGALEGRWCGGRCLGGGDLYLRVSLGLRCCLSSFRPCLHPKGSILGGGVEGVLDQADVEAKPGGKYFFVVPRTGCKAMTPS